MYFADTALSILHYSKHLKVVVLLFLEGDVGDDIHQFSGNVESERIHNIWLQLKDHHTIINISCVATKYLHIYTYLPQKQLNNT
jgi:hypothetical protein